MKIIHDKILDKHFPFAGDCIFCGHPDKRHRLWDAILGMADAGEKSLAIADDFGLSTEAVNRVIDLRPYKGRARK